MTFMTCTVRFFDRDMQIKALTRSLSCILGHHLLQMLLNYFFWKVLEVKNMQYWLTFWFVFVYKSLCKKIANLVAKRFLCVTLIKHGLYIANIYCNFLSFTKTTLLNNINWACGKGLEKTWNSKRYIITDWGKQCCKEFLWI